MLIFFSDIEPDHPGFLHFITNFFYKAFDREGKYNWEKAEAVFYVLLLIPIIIIICVVGTRRLNKIPSGFQNFLEGIVKLFDNFCKGVIGDKGRHFVPLIGTFFIYILIMNLFGLIPGMKSPTSNPNITISLAIVAIISTQIAGFYFHGFGYLKHFCGDPIWLAPMMLPIHIVGEFVAKPLSLSMRLFGNIMGEKTAISIFISLGVLTTMYIPFQLPMTALAVFTSFVQALIFSLLLSIYISSALGEHE